MKDLNFKNVYSEFYPKTLVYLKLKTSNNEVAEELCSDIFLKIYNNLVTYDPSKARLSSWICQITNNHLIDYYRKDSRSISFSNIADIIKNEMDESDNIPVKYVDHQSPEKKMIGNEIFDGVMGLINNLSGIKQKIAVLYFIEQYKYQEICDELELPLGTVKGMIFRIREVLQEKVKSNYSYNYNN